jgi:hypothetical protein
MMSRGLAWLMLNLDVSLILRAEFLRRLEFRWCAAPLCMSMIASAE